MRFRISVMHPPRPPARARVYEVMYNPCVIITKFAQQISSAGSAVPHGTARNVICRYSNSADANYVDTLQCFIVLV